MNTTRTVDVATHGQVMRFTLLDTAVRPSTFARFCTSIGICGDRELFHAYALSSTPREEWTLDGLTDLWVEFNHWGRKAMLAAEDARDLRDTQADALR